MMSNKYSSSKKDFLKNEIWILAWAGASQRANIFPKDMDEKSRIIKRAEIKEIVFKVFAQFELLERISDDLVINKISYLVKRFNNRGISFNVGHAQKLINLLLKYYWCSGWLKNEPPHCPIDRIILTKAKIKDNGKTPSWTKIDNIKIYKKYIEELKNIVAPKSLAVWELESFNRRN